MNLSCLAIGSRPRCLLCCDPVLTLTALCPGCLGDLPRNLPCCRRCALPLPIPVTGGTRAAQCGRCLRHPPHYSELLAPYRYEAPCDFLVTRLKFGGQRYQATLMSRLLLTHLEDSLVDLPDLLVPVPLHRTRLVERGFNQAHELAAPLAKYLKIRYRTDALHRARNTQSQVGLGMRKRRSNVRRAFRATLESRDRHVAVVDDVVTTGSTANEIARELLHNGARRVSIWAFARALPPTLR